MIWRIFFNISRLMITFSTVFTERSQISMTLVSIMRSKITYFFFYLCSTFSIVELFFHDFQCLLDFCTFLSSALHKTTMYKALTGFIYYYSCIEDIYYYVILFIHIVESRARTIVNFRRIVDSGYFK